MAKKKPTGTSRTRKQKPSGAATAIHVPSARPHQVQDLEHAHKFAKPKRIHPRRTLPFIREGVEREFHSLTPQAMLEFHRPSAVAAAPASGNVVLTTNTELTSPAEQQTGSNVGEPSVAANGQVVLFTGNWYAAIS